MAPVQINRRRTPMFRLPWLALAMFALAAPAAISCTDASSISEV